MSITQRSTDGSNITRQNWRSAGCHISTPSVNTVDKNAAYLQAFKELQAQRIMPSPRELRQWKYLNNLVEQDHRFIKRLVKPGMGFFSLKTA
jgi:IS6 family transposase